MISEEQAKQIKQQILKQIDSWKTPEEQKLTAKKQIQEMSEQELEEFLIKNKLIKEPSSVKESKSSQQCIFCEIAKGNTSSFKIDENKSSLATLEINPLSKAHSLIIPKNHISQIKIPTSAFSLAKKIAKKIKTKFKPEKIDISTDEVSGHGIINIIPYYKDKKLERKKATQEELAQIQEKLKKKTKAKKGKKENVLKQIQKLPKFPIRIP